MRARDAGMEVVYEGIRLTPARDRQRGAGRGRALVGLSILSGSHVPLVRDVMARMREEGLDDVPVIVGGIIPPEDESVLRKDGRRRGLHAEEFRAEHDYGRHRAHRRERRGESRGVAIVVRFKPRISRETVHRRSQRLVFIIGGLTVGGAAVLIVLLADVAQSLFRELLAIWPYAPLLITPLGFALCSLLTRHVFDGAEGSGIPQVIAARRSPDDAFRRSLVSLRIAFGKIVLLTLGLLCGASSGREGPTVQIGASIMFALGRLAPHRQPGFMLAGSAAGVAAAFNTPLAGIVFGIEEMSRSFEERTSTVIIGTVIAAGLTSLALLGNYDYFGTTPATLPFGAGWLATLSAACWAVSSAACSRGRCSSLRAACPEPRAVC